MGTSSRITKDSAYYFSAQFWMVLLVGFLPGLLRFIQNLLVIRQLESYGELYAYYQALSSGVAQWLIIYLLPGIIGAAVVVALAYTKIIDWKALNWTHVLIMLLLVLLCDEQLCYSEKIASVGIGADAAVAISLFRTYAEVVSLIPVWRWFIICVYLLTVSKRIKKIGRIILITTGVLVACTILALLINVAFYRFLQIPNNILPYLEVCSQRFISTSWINRLIILCMTLAMGKHCWKRRVIIVLMVIRLAVAWILRPLLVFSLQLGIAGMPVAETITYMTVGAISLLYQGSLCRQLKKHR